jgi:hypothetical protein
MDVVLVFKIGDKLSGFASEQNVNVLALTQAPHNPSVSMTTNPIARCIQISN